MNESNSLLQAVNDDPFLGQIVAVPCNSEVGKMLIEGFGEKWVDDTRCRSLDEDCVHVVGVIMRQTKVSGRKSGNPTNDDITWEHTSLGETSVSTAYLIGIQAGTQIVTLHQQTSANVNSNKNTEVTQANLKS